MLKIVSLLFILISVLPAKAQTAMPGTLQRPRLMVGIVVDQMRWDYLYRYYDRYSAGGFKRMLQEGFSCENTLIDYVPTKTAIGHSSVYTGSVPAIHGIAGNDFINQHTGNAMYCVADSTVKTVGSTSARGKMSPRNLLTTTFTDELKLATNLRSKVIGVGLKDRGSILPAGHTGDAAYWLDEVTGNWISSTWYMNELPGWVEQMNRQGGVKKYLQKDWNTLYPIGSYVQSTPDDNAYEKVFKGATRATFPVPLADLSKTNGSAIIRYTAFGNSLTFDMAKAAVENEHLGQDPITDFLAVSLSSTDFVGHHFGMNSVEAEDTYLRLDLELAEFFLFLDKQVGKGQYTVFLTADHGGAHNARFLADNQLPGGVWNASQRLKEVNDRLQQKFGSNRLILSLMNNQVHLNRTLIHDRNLDEAMVRKECVAYFEEVEGVAWAVDMNEVANSPVPAVIRERLLNGYHRERSGDIFLLLKSGWYASASQAGTDHANWHGYDAHIPLLWMGWGIKPGHTSRNVSITDIAATASALLRIQMPSGCVGQPIQEALQ